MADVTSTFAAKDVGFTSTVNRMQRSLAGFQSGISGFAAKAAGLVTAFVGIQQSVAAFNKALSMGGRLDDLSKTTGATAGELLLLEKAFELAGSSADAVGPAIARLNRFMVEASNGGAAQVETMSKLGLSYDQLKGRTPTEQMQLLAKSIMALPTPAQRTAAAMDIFGRSGSTLIPLFANFSGELDKAQGYLGSLPGLMDQSAGAMADMEDDIGALGDKFNQFVAGLVTGAAGAENFASALAKIDTAGIGANLGESLRVAFDAPHETAKAIGYTLLTGIAEAGNLLDAAFRKAQDTYAAMFNNPGLYRGLENVLTGLFAKVGETFFATLADGLKSVIGIMDWNPLWKPFTDLAKGAITDLQQDITDAGIAASNTIEQGMTQMKAAYNAAAQSSSYIKRDTFGAAGYAQKAAGYFMEAGEVSAKIEERSARTSENYKQGSAALRAAMQDIRGFDLKEKMGPDARPDWTKSNKPPPNIIPRGNESLGGGGGGGGGFSPSGGGFGFRPQDPTQDQTVAQMRGDAAFNRRMGRFDEFMAGGMFRAAARTKEAAERAKNDKLENQMRRDFMRDTFGASNLGEVGRNFERDARKAGMTADQALNRMGIDRATGQSREDALKGFIDQQALPPNVRDQRGGGGQGQAGGGGGGGNQLEIEPAVKSAVQAIRKFVESINEKLPQHALVPGD